ATFGTPEIHAATTAPADQTIDRTWTIEPDLSRRVVETRGAHVREGEHLAIAFESSATAGTCNARQGTTVLDAIRLPRGCAVRTRQPNDEVIAAILEYVRDQARPGALPTTDAIEPRKLARVRRSGWASPWEMALLLANYLRQTHVDAVPMMARSARHGAADPL